ncbi:hypothetical protein G169_gp10 [Pseudomonas phage AF]|uniref:hypothetical protein n=1 Tax=Pseudomonas phage AF TaxID=1235689 RepID=UPI0002971A05|nr:hypothetical protein G169_gp10 [Pseudomonas phage AF]AFV50625.1 hypothetical protein AF_010 [Pseudomonas phage AF]
MSQQYRVTRVPHYIGGRLVFPDRGDESLVTLEPGVKPGQWLVKVGGGEAKDGDDQKALLEEASALGLKPHHATGPEKLKELIAEAKAKDGRGEEEPPEDKNLPDA